MSNILTRVSRCFIKIQSGTRIQMELYSRLPPMWIQDGILCAHHQTFLQNQIQIFVSYVCGIFYEKKYSKNGKRIWSIFVDVVTNFSVGWSCSEHCLSRFYLLSRIFRCHILDELNWRLDDSKIALFDGLNFYSFCLFDWLKNFFIEQSNFFFESFEVWKL